MSSDTKRRGTRFIAEGVLIVGSILLALALDAWWDRVQEAGRRTDLVQALSEDFETTRTRLSLSIARGDSLVASTTAFLVDAQSPTPLPVDSLRELATAAFVNFEFVPTLASYRAAAATGDLRLVQSRELLESLAEFDQALEYFEARSQFHMEGYYVGPTADLRSTLGSLGALSVGGTIEAIGVPEPFRLSDREYHELARSRPVYGIQEGVLVLRRQLVRSLRNADAAAAKVLSELKELDSE